MEKRKRKRAAPSLIGMREVARRVGVSTITVSRVLSEPGRVAKATRERVLKAVHDMGYVPNHVARGFASSRTRLVGVVVPTVANLMFADKIEALAEVLRPRGYQLLVTHNAYSLDTEAQLVEALLAQRPAGMVLTGLTHLPRTARLLRKMAVPTVETWNLGRKPIDLLVGFSNEAAAHAMVAKLAERGYRHIALVHPHAHANDRAADRLAGYRRAMKELGLPWRPQLEQPSDFGFASGARALVSLLESGERLEAVFFGNDALATGALLECRRRGIRVPEELGIAGFDDVALAAQLDPPLTTVRVPMGEIGRRAAELLLEKMEGGRPGARIIDLGFEIVERGSTRGGRIAAITMPA